MNRLTPLEEKIMLLIWKHEKCTVKEIVIENPDLELVITTVSTVFILLKKKGFLKHKRNGRAYIYYSKISSEQYREYLTKELLFNYFDNDKKLITDLLQ